MNKTFSLIFLIFNSFPMMGQESYPMVFFVSDESSGERIFGANVMIKELGYQKETSDTNGKVSFSKVPVGEIHYIVSAENYVGEDGTFNITSEVKSNTLNIKLRKKPSKEESAKMILVDGEVVDDKNQDVKNAEVELKVGNVVKKATTDVSGNFSVEINLDEVRYNDPDFNLEVSKGVCKHREQFLVPQNNYVYKKVILQCASGLSSEAGISSSSADLLRKEIGEWEFILTGCSRSGSDVVCGFKLTSKYRNRNIYLGIGGAATAQDNYSYDYKASLVKLANQEYNGGGYMDKLLVADVTADGQFTFPNVSNRATMFSLISIRVYGDDLTDQRIELNNVKF